MFRTIIDIDKSLFLFLNNLGTESWDPFWLFISNKIWMFLLITPVILALYYKQERRNMIYSLFILLLCFGITDWVHVHLFKNIFMRLRPCWDPEIAPFSRILVDKGGLYGFVSGHAANSAAIVSFMLISLKHVHVLVKYGLVIWVFLVSYSRIYLGKHYLLDVIFGILVGFLIAQIVFKICQHIKLVK